MTCAYCFCMWECHVVTVVCVRVSIEDAGARSVVGTENVSYSVIRNARWAPVFQSFAECSSQTTHFVFQMILTLSVMTMMWGMINPWGLLKWISHWWNSEQCIHNFPQFSFQVFHNGIRNVVVEIPESSVIVGGDRSKTYIVSHWLPSSKLVYFQQNKIRFYYIRGKNTYLLRMSL